MLFNPRHDFFSLDAGALICLIDRQAPFGNQHLLPRGTLREPPANLRRANYIFITKCEGADNRDLIKEIRKFNQTAGILECTHKALHLQNLYTKEELPLSWLKGRHIGALSGIARPESFEDKLTDLGAELHITSRFADHHRFSSKELNHFISRCVRRDLDAVVTTEKDSVRFPYKPPSTDVPVLFLRVEIEILRGHDVWEDLMQQVCAPPEVRLPELVFA